LVFQLYGRALHPELFQIYAARKLSRGDYKATVEITSAGHVVKWQYQGLTLTEVATAAHHPLPERRRLMRIPLRGQGSDRVSCRGGVTYQVEYHLDRVDPAVFWTYQHELCAEGRREGMLHRFDSSGRLALGALSYIFVETRARTMLVQALHTFPDDCAIVKSQSRFVIP
jgi:hypothetical protein